MVDAALRQEITEREARLAGSNNNRVHRFYSLLTRLAQTVTRCHPESTRTETLRSRPVLGANQVHRAKTAVFKQLVTFVRLAGEQHGRLAATGHRLLSTTHPQYPGMPAADAFAMTTAISSIPGR